MNQREMERQTAAVTLSDMEVFVFPELMYSLVLANIMSPRLWLWRDDPWFKGVRKMKPTRRLQRLKQYVMDHYVFNLDLDTWGMTSQKRELARFAGFLSPEEIAQSNALFGYQGDAYYFDIDIRTHFGLDKYAADVIPYWKTETVEAMDAFRHREGFSTGAGECVSLAALYAAALFVVAGIPLEQVFLMATPLHSQNFVDVDDGVLINNRRLVTKPMWFNGTQISGQARRALENERVTIVSHQSGWIHTLYRRATIDRTAYRRFAERLGAYLSTRLTPEILGNFLRQSQRKCRACFVLRHTLNGAERFISLDTAFSFEHESPYKVTDHTRGKLLDLIPPEMFSASHCPCNTVLDDLEAFIRDRTIDLDDADDLAALKAEIGDACVNAALLVNDLAAFCHTVPRLPSEEVAFGQEKAPLRLSADMSRDEVIAHVDALRESNETADMAFYAWRDLTRTPAAPFVKAALERNPVSVAALSGFSLEDAAAAVAALPGESIYDGEARLAQPDEVWNFKRGDGLEKALLVANVARGRGAGAMRLDVADGAATLSLSVGGALCRFPSSKRPAETTWEL
jgi:hypothetical protein